MDQQNSWQTCRRKGREGRAEKRDEMERMREKLGETEVDAAERKMWLV